MDRVSEERARELAALSVTTSTGGDVLEVEEILTGFGNHNWRVWSDTESFVLKVGRGSRAEKWRAAAQVSDVARQLGLCVPTCRFIDVIDGSVVRLFEWIEGRPATALASDAEGQARLGRSLGTAIAELHCHAMDGFSSRFDHTAPTHPSWERYVSARLDGIVARALAESAPHPSLIEAGVVASRHLANLVSEAAAPVICHRDLHAPNLLVDDAGELVAILDWDMPELWDQAGEWFKLEVKLFRDLPNVRAAFERAYLAVHGAPPQWEERKRLVHLLEDVNILSNAATLADDFVAGAAQRLESAL